MTASPVTFAERLRGDLLLVHGSGDDNVHYQSTETLDQRARRGGQAVPDDGVPEPHALHLRAQGTTLHLYSLLTRYLDEHLPR